MAISRRKCLTSAGGALLAGAAGALALPAGADGDRGQGDVLYGHGMVWNKQLPGVAGQVRLSFDVRIDRAAGTGLGTAIDPLHPDWSFHFDIQSVKEEKQPRGEIRWTLDGRVTRAVDPANVGSPIRMLAETVGDTTAVVIALGDLVFPGAGLVAKDPGQYDSVVITLIRIIFGRRRLPAHRNTAGLRGIKHQK